MEGVYLHVVAYVLFYYVPHPYLTENRFVLLHKPLLKLRHAQHQRLGTRRAVGYLEPHLVKFFRIVELVLAVDDEASLSIMRAGASLADEGAGFGGHESS